MKPIVYSYSAIKQFLTCPRQFAEVKIWKNVVTAPTSATDFGVRAHSAFEDFIAKGTPLPADMCAYQKLADTLNAAPGQKHCEIKYGLTAAMEPCAFFGHGVRIRGVADLTVRNGTKVHIVDYKSGKDTRPDTSQLELMALMEFAANPECQEVTGALLFFIAGSMTKNVWTRDDVPRLWAKWLALMDKADRAIEAGVFQESPSGLCRGWCPVTECHHWQEKKK
jgi:PD-(D/E)XK nuclease superfamily